jgi:tetratricopeptide (TPR) repeat protein
MKSSAQLFALVLLCSSSLARAEESAPLNLEDSARVHQRRGAELFRQKQYRAALFEFQRAYDKSPEPRLLYEIGRAKLELRDYLGAARSYQRYIDDSAMNERSPDGAPSASAPKVSVTITMQYRDVDEATLDRLQALASTDQGSALRVVFEQLASGRYGTPATPAPVAVPVAVSAPVASAEPPPAPLEQPAAVVTAHSRVARGIDASDPYLTP